MMTAVLDPETLLRLRTLSPRRAFEEVRNAVYRSGAVSSDDFLDAYEELVLHGVLSWEQIEEFGA